MTKQLIVTADDFGLSAEVNRGVVGAHEHGIVTAASIMVHATWALEAARYARSHPDLDVGLHLDLGEWRYGPSGWELAYRIVDDRDAAAVGAEIDLQIGVFIELIGRPPSHLDSHQHVHLREPTRALLLERASHLGGIPVRSITSSIRYDGRFYGQSGKGDPLRDFITVEWLCELLASLPDGPTELGVHPAAPGGKPVSGYHEERALEFQALCDPVVKTVIEDSGISLTTFSAAKGLNA